MEITRQMYEYALQRIEELLPITADSMDDPNMPELLIVSSVVEEYEQLHFPIRKPTLGEVIADAMREAGMTGKQLADALGVSQSRISDFINDRAEPTLKVARMLCKVLHINPIEMLEEAA